MSHTIEHKFCWYIFPLFSCDGERKNNSRNLLKNETRSGHYQHEEIHTTSTGEMVFYSFFLTYYISNFEGNNCWKSVNFVLTLVSDTDYIITYMQHATLKEYEYTSFTVHTW